jgi:hypothetical protein
MRTRFYNDDDDVRRRNDDLSQIRSHYNVYDITYVGIYLHYQNEKMFERSKSRQIIILKMRVH